MKHCIVGVLLALSAWPMTPIGHAQESLEKGLLRQGPKLIKYLKDHGYQNVGVLKFLVSREGQGFSDNVGTMNLLLARRLELALVLANDPRTPVGIIDNASGVAHTIAGANHLNAEGRKKLFTGQYPLAWGDDIVQADAFVTGTTEISRDLRTLTVTLYCFDRVNNKLIPLAEDFRVANSTDHLVEMGESFVLRRTFDDGKTEPIKAEIEEQAFQEAVKVINKEIKHPAQQDDQPVTLRVFYDGKQVPYEFRDGKAFIPEPSEGQTVQFGLKRDSGKERYGVVLKVNGENTLGKKRQQELSCRKWILAPGEGPWIISGYQIGDDMLEKFRVASAAESREREISYGPDVGTITLTVYREQKGKRRPQIFDEEGLYEKAVKDLPELPDRPKNYNQLKAMLLEPDYSRTPIVRSSVGVGHREPSKAQIVGFVGDSKPIVSVTIVCYRKR